MDLSAPISYNSITFTPPAASPSTPRSGYEIEDIDVTNVVSDGYLDPRALQDGLDASDVYVRGRSISISAAVYGSTKGDVWDKLQDLNAAFHPVLAYNADTANYGFLAFAFRQPTSDTVTWSSGYISLEYFARPVGEPQFNVNRLRTVDGGRGFSIPVQLRLICRDPRKYLQTQQNVTVSTSTQTATYRGDYNSFPVIQVSMSAVGASNLTIIVNTTSIVVDMSARSNAIQLDFAKRTLVDSGGNSIAQLIVSAPAYPSLSTGSTYRIANTTGVSNSTMVYREAFT